MLNTRNRNKKRQRGLIIFSLFLLFMMQIPKVSAEGFVPNKGPIENELLLLNEEEQQYVIENPHISVYVVDGMAPIQYQDENGKLQGITKKIFHEIEMKTGLTFDFIFIEDIRTALKERQAKIMAAIPFTFEDTDFYEDIQLSPEYLTTNQILLLHEGEEATDLKNKIYGAVIGSPIPSSVDRRTTIFFHTREEILDAVNKGEVDFSYINAFSASYYLLQNSYDHIVSVPSAIQNTELSFGYLDKEDLYLPQILNKALKTINTDQIQNFIVEEATKIDREVSLQLVLTNFTVEITSIILLFILGLSGLTIKFRRDNREFKLQNNRFRALSELSEEYFYEYDVIQDNINISDELKVLLTNYDYKESLSVLQAGLKKTFTEHRQQTRMIEGHNHSVENIILKGAFEKKGTYKMVNLIIRDEQHAISMIIGKLIDISNFEKEKESLKIKAERDGLTKLYNYESSRELIKERMLQFDSSFLAAFIVLDIDYFKSINDTLGHHEGNRILQKMGKLLLNNFRKDDIPARIGGDEFSIYVDRFTMKEQVIEKCHELIESMNEAVDDVPISISIGLVFIKEEDNYQTAFKHADEALYKAKRSGRARIAIYEE